MKAKHIALAKVRERVADVVRELGFALHHSESSTGSLELAWAAQRAEELAGACAAASNAAETARKLHHYIAEQSLAANKRAMKASRIRPEGGSP